MRVAQINDLLDDQTAIRLSLLENGYAPLPAREKVVNMRGWPSIEATPELIEQWKLSRAFTTTAMRIEGDLVAIDVDVDDANCDALCDALEEAVPVLKQAPLRWGKGDKRMYLLRCPERPGITSSHVFMREGNEDDKHRLETFGAGTTRYFTCYGPHTLGDTTADGVEILVEYEWEGGVGPHTVAVADLPEISTHELITLTDIANEFMEAWGWERSLRSVTGTISDEPVYDLTDDMAFDCLDGVVRDLAELVAYAKSSRTARCSASFHEAGASNRSRCIVERHHDGTAKVFDFDEYRWHHAEGGDRRTAGERAADDATLATNVLGEQLRAGGFADLVGASEPFDSWFDAAIQDLLDNWGWMPGPGAGYAVPLVETREKVTLPSFKEMHNSIFTMGEPGPRGGKPPRYTATAIWAMAEDRVEISGYQYNPTVPGRVIEDETGVWINNYVAPETADPIGEQVWFDFVEHLIPDEEERAWFHNWLAYKVQNLEERGAAIVFVSEGVQGTGRGTLFRIMAGLFGPDNVRGVPFGKLVGTHGQSQFDDWKLDTVLVHCDEASSSEGQYHSAAKRKQYDALKDLVDPASYEAEVNVKGEARRKDAVYFSLMVASNYGDALPIEAQDRRFTVLTTPNKLELDSKLAVRLFGMLERKGFNPGFTTAIRRAYLKMEPVRDDFMTPIETEAKAEMVELNKGIVEQMVDDWMELKGSPEILSSTALCARMTLQLEQRGMGRMAAHVQSAVGAALSALKYAKAGRASFKGKRHTIYFKASKAGGCGSKRGEVKAEIMETCRVLPDDELEKVLVA